jgi:NAD(P)-dependent dehydrogenase (short-subunit alcohol dehydrogenase family)
MSGVLDGRSGIITGAAGGIGHELARAFVAAGAQVALVDTDGDAVRAVAAELGDATIGLAADITDEANVEATVAAAEERFGQLDYLVNNAGIRHQGSFLDHDLATWRRTIDVNLTGAFICSQAVVRRMLPRGEGKILNIASIAGLMALRNRVAYTSSKAAVVGLTRAMAFELGAQGIYVNAIAPGVIETPMTASYFTDPAFAELIIDNVPLGRWGQPSDLAKPAIFLCGPDSDYVHGQILCVDGGWVSGKGY